MSCSGSWDGFEDVKVTFADGFRQLSDITEKCDYRVPTLRIVGGYNKSRGSGNACLCLATQKQGDPSLPVAVLLPELKKKKNPSVLFVSFQSCRRLRAVWLLQNLDCLPCEFHAILILSPACCRLAPLLALWALRCICLSAVTHPRGLDAPAGPFSSFSPPLPASSVDIAVICSALTQWRGFTAQRRKIANFSSKSSPPRQITYSFLLPFIGILELRNLKTVFRSRERRRIMLSKICRSCVDSKEIS